MVDYTKQPMGDKFMDDEFYGRYVLRLLYTTQTTDKHLSMIKDNFNDRM